ncbi:MAG TPA: VOC family protein [Pyrinomonadaceae bacterium]
MIRTRSTANTAARIYDKTILETRRPNAVLQVVPTSLITVHNPHFTIQAMREARRALPMIHVPDVRATVEWYQAIGFTVNYTFDGGGEGLSFANLSFGAGEVMFNTGGRASTEHRREVDLYVYVDDVGELYSRVKDGVEVLKEIHETFYGMREFIVRDLNGFWVTFAEQVRELEQN